MQKISFREALNQALDEEMARDPKVYLMGEEVGESGQTGRRWILDGIDGTHNFLRGTPNGALLSPTLPSLRP